MNKTKEGYVRKGETLKQAIQRHVEADPITIRDRQTLLRKWGITPFQKHGKP